MELDAIGIAGNEERLSRTPNRKVSLASVIIPVLNGAATIGQQLQALSRQTYSSPWEIVVSDNGSADETVRIAEDWGKRLPIRVIDASLHKGASYARNRGAEAAEGDLLLFCDADDEVSEVWMSAMVSTARGSDLVGGRNSIEALNPASTRGWRATPSSDGLPTRYRFLPFTPSGNMGIWKSIFEDLGGFHEDYEALEDVELSWRAQLQGYRLAFAQEAELRYRHRTDLSEVARQFYRYAYFGERLRADYAMYGVATTSRREIIKLFVWLGSRLPYLVTTRRRRGIWVRNAASTSGTMAGRYRWRHQSVPVGELEPVSDTKAAAKDS